MLKRKKRAAMLVPDCAKRGVEGEERETSKRGRRGEQGDSNGKSRLQLRERVEKRSRERGVVRIVALLSDSCKRREGTTERKVKKRMEWGS